MAEPGFVGHRHHQVLIVGGGSGGLTVASQLLRARLGLDVAILAGAGGGPGAEGAVIRDQTP